MPTGRRTRLRAATATALLTATLATSASAPATPSAPTSATSAPALPATAPASRPSAPSLVDGWPTTTPRAAGFRPRVLRSLTRAARAVDSSCHVIVRKGRLVSEKNWGTPRLEPREVFSVTKSVASALVGIAVRDGSLSLDDRVATYVPEWRGTASADVTVRHLLSNDSGRFWSSATDYEGLIRARNRTRYAVGLDQAFEPGTVWAYNNAAIQVLDAVLREATGQDVATFAETRLFTPLGMRHTRMTTDASGRSTNVFAGLQTTCLDLARFGRLFLDNGRVGRTRIVSKAWVRDATGRSSTAHNAGYGLLWWLNRPGPLRGPTDPVDEDGQPITPLTGQLAPGASETSFAAVGLGGQVVFVDRVSRTVVVRLGRLGSGQRPFAFADAARVVTEGLR